MEWFSALFSALVTCITILFSRWSWTAPDRWVRQGYFDNGLGTKIVEARNPGSFRGAVLTMKVFAVFVAAMAFGGAAITITWIWRAL